jgi:hypothetical protein
MLAEAVQETGPNLDPSHQGRTRPPPWIAVLVASLDVLATHSSAVELVPVPKAYQRSTRFGFLFFFCFRRHRPAGG